MRVVCPKGKNCIEKKCSHKDVHYEDEKWCQSFKDMYGNALHDSKCPDCVNIKLVRKEKLEKLNDRLGYS